jgi:hypothetical protein
MIGRLLLKPTPLLDKLNDHIIDPKHCPWTLEDQDLMETLAGHGKYADVDRKTLAEVRARLSPQK